MRTAFLALAAAGIGMGGAQGATLHCTFTEPFIAIDFDTATGIVQLISPDEADPATGKPVPRTIGTDAKLVREDAWKDFQTFYLKAGGETLMTLQLTGLADDGMSERIFPFVGRYGELAGGCETEAAPAYDLSRVYDDFGIKN